MTAVEAQPQPLYHSPRGLYDFQAYAVAYGYEALVNLFVYDTGIGKSHIAMATAAMLYEDEKVDTVLLVAEKNKLAKDEWPKDFETFTDLDVALYWKVPPKEREKRRNANHQVLLSTYETVRNDAMVMRKVEERGKTVNRKFPGPLLEWLLTKQRVMVVYDEITKLGNRGSGLYKAHEFMIDTLRKAGVEVRIEGLTATPIERGPENFFNLGRILTPQTMPTVQQYERDYVAEKNFFGDPIRFKNLNPDDCAPGVVPFTERMAHIVRRKRKTDPDVIDQFPQVVEEEPLFVRLGDQHQSFYDTVREVALEGDEWEQRAFTTVLRQIAGHPLSLTRSKGNAAQAIVSAVGEAGLRALGNAKGEAMVRYLDPIVNGQGEKVVVFTFFANSILPLLAEEWSRPTKEGGLGVPIAINAPFLSDADRERNKAAFRSGEVPIFLTSDAGARGINLPEALYVVEYEMALTHANRTQRFNRNHRIDSKHPSVTHRSLIAYDTIEEGIANGVLRRNGWSDKLLDHDDPGENFMTAEMRRMLLRMGKRRVEG